MTVKHILKTAALATDAVLDAITYESSLTRLTWTLALSGRSDPARDAEAILASRDRAALAERIRMMKRTKLIETRKKGHDFIISLTEKGQNRLLRGRIMQAPRRTDGMTTMVIFDIPETATAARSAFRHFLKSAGFKRLQLSVWTIDRDVAPVLKDWIKRQGVEKWVGIYSAAPE